MASGSLRCIVILPVVFDAATPIAVRAHAVHDLGTWVNVLVGVVPFVGSTSDLASLSTASHVLEISVTCSLKALLASPAN